MDTQLPMRTEHECYLIADIYETLTHATLHNKMLAGLRCVINAPVMYHVHEKIPPGMSHYIIPVYNDDLFALMRCMHERGADPKHVEKAFRNAFLCGTLSYLHSQADAILLWRVRAFPPKKFAKYMNSFIQGLTVRPTRASHAYIPDIRVMYALFDGLTQGRWKDSEFIQGVADLAKIKTPFPIGLLHKAVPFIVRKDAITLMRAVVSMINPLDTNRVVIISTFMGLWRLTQKELASIKILIDPRVIYVVLLGTDLSAGDMRWVLGETLRGVKMDDFLWQLVFKRKDYELCVWLMNSMYLVPSHEMLINHTNKHPDARSFCDKLMNLYSMSSGAKSKRR